MLLLDFRLEGGQVVVRFRSGSEGSLEDEAASWPLGEVADLGIAFEDDEEGVYALVLEPGSEVTLDVAGVRLVSRLAER